ncbi:MAG: trigger factor family protein, partial [Calditrichia bacterium]
MQTKVETISSYSKKIKVNISGEELHSVEQKLIKKYQKQASIPGFRKGKAPANLVHKQYHDLIHQEMIEEAVKTFYSAALDEVGIEPVTQGIITDVNVDNIHEGMAFDVEVEVEPDVELKKYKNLQVEKDVVEVNEAMLNEGLERLREQYAT